MIWIIQGAREVIKLLKWASASEKEPVEGLEIFFFLKQRVEMKTKI